MQEWQAAGFGPEEAERWQEAGFRPWDAALWQRVWPNPVVCGRWRGGQFSPQDMLEWTTALNGLVYPGVQFDTARSWTFYGFTSKEAVRWLRAGFAWDEAGLAAAWNGRGFSPGDAARLCSEGLGPDDATPS